MSVNKVRKLMGVKKQAACGTVAKVRDRLCHPGPTVVPQDVVADCVSRTKASLAQAGPWYNVILMIAHALTPVMLLLLMSPV